MDSGFLTLSYKELKARRDALSEMILEPYKDITYSITIHDDRIPLLEEMDEALEVLKRAREKSSLRHEDIWHGERRE